MKPRDMAAASALNLEHYWMPFTDNRRFKARPKLVASATTICAWVSRLSRGPARVVELVRQGSLFTSSNGDRSLETNT